jgi:hypothetical protein
MVTLLPRQEWSALATRPPCWRDQTRLLSREDHPAEARRRRRWGSKIALLELQDSAARKTEGNRVAWQRPSVKSHFVSTRHGGMPRKRTAERPSCETVNVTAPLRQAGGASPCSGSALIRRRPTCSTTTSSLPSKPIALTDSRSAAEPKAAGAARFDRQTPLAPASCPPLSDPASRPIRPSSTRAPYPTIFRSSSPTGAHACRGFPATG